jgi:hypothetical protein
MQEVTNYPSSHIEVLSLPVSSPHRSFSPGPNLRLQ